jgi:hypothetical protein
MMKKHLAATAACIMLALGVVGSIGPVSTASAASCRWTGWYTTYVTYVPGGKVVHQEDDYGCGTGIYYYVKTSNFRHYFV